MENNLRYRLTIDVDSPERLTTWDIAANLPNLLEIALNDVSAAELQRFELRRLDGPPIAVALERCVEVEIGFN